MVGVALAGPVAWVQGVLPHVCDMPQLCVCGIWCGRDAPAAQAEELSGQQRYADADEMLADSVVEGVLLGAPVDERSFWCTRILRSGRSVLCESPLEDRAGSLSEALQACSAEQRICLVPGKRPDRLCELIENWPDELGRRLHFRLDVCVPRPWLSSQTGGVVHLTAVELLAHIDSHWGPVDSLWAETRSLARGTRHEDVATVYLRLFDGAEGVLSADGLGEQGSCRLTVHGTLGSLQVTDRAPISTFSDWAAGASVLIAHLTHGTAPEAGAADTLAGHNLSRWIDHSARQRREMNRREAMDAC